VLLRAPSSGSPSAVTLAGRRKQGERDYRNQSRTRDGHPGTSKYELRLELQDLNLPPKFEIRFQLRKQMFFSSGIAKLEQSTLALHLLTAGITAGTEM